MSRIPDEVTPLVVRMYPGDKPGDLAYNDMDEYSACAVVLVNSTTKTATIGPMAGVFNRSYFAAIIRELRVKYKVKHITWVRASGKEVHL